MTRRRIIAAAMLVAVGAPLSGCEEPQPTTRATENNAGVFMVGGSRSGALAVSDVEHGAVPEAGIVTDGRGRPIDHLFASNALIGGLVGGILGSTAQGALLGAMEGGSAGYLAANSNPKGDSNPSALHVDPSRLDAFHTMLQKGYLPANFWGATAPPVRVRVLMYSVPQPASLVISGKPTTFATTIDLYMLPDDIRSSTLEHAGNVPCRVADAIVPGLQQPDGGEALTVRCILTPLESPAPMKLPPRGGHRSEVN
jgi:hypothetical protein